jgi:hypothetical protein
MTDIQSVTFLQCPVVILQRPAGGSITLDLFKRHMHYSSLVPYPRRGRSRSHPQLDTDADLLDADGWRRQRLGMHLRA